MAQVNPLPFPPSHRVEAVQQALVALTGVPAADQLVMCEGVRLDPHKALSAYGLPVVGGVWVGGGRARQVPAALPVFSAATLQLGEQEVGEEH